MFCLIRANPRPCNLDYNATASPAWTQGTCAAQSPSAQQSGARSPKEICYLARSSSDRRDSSVGLCDSDLFAEVNVLNCIEELNPVLHWALERLTTGNQARAAGTLVDNRRERSVGKVLRAARPARIDQARTPR